MRFNYLKKRLVAFEGFDCVWLFRIPFGLCLIVLIALDCVVCRWLHWFAFDCLGSCWVFSSDGLFLIGLCCFCLFLDCSWMCDCVYRLLSYCCWILSIALYLSIVYSWVPLCLIVDGCCWVPGVFDCGWLRLIGFDCIGLFLIVVDLVWLFLIAWFLYCYGFAGDGYLWLFSMFDVWRLCLNVFVCFWCVLCCWLLLIKFNCVWMRLKWFGGYWLRCMDCDCHWLLSIAFNGLRVLLIVLYCFGLVFIAFVVGFSRVILVAVVHC